MRIYRDMDLVEQLGFGAPRILQTYGKECFYFSENFIRMSFPAEKVVENVVEKRQEKIIEFMTQNKEISTSQIAKLLKITVRIVQRDLEQLSKQNKVRRIGSAKGGYWLVNTENK
jgi:ATP-dependent DNA helicase RecG